MISSRLSIKDSLFHIVSQDKTETLEQTSLDVVIVGANPGLAKQYYEGEFSADRESYTPDCYSLDGITPNGGLELHHKDLKLKHVPILKDLLLLLQTNLKKFIYCK